MREKNERDNSTKMRERDILSMERLNGKSVRIQNTVTDVGELYFTTVLPCRIMVNMFHRRLFQ